ncbi:MAG: Eco29kI family restriction endonuclease [Verrucomicrobiales bacterium]
MGSENVFNPLDRKTSGKASSKRCSKAMHCRLPKSAPRGAGISQFTTGARLALSPAFRTQLRTGSHYPIYVGKAVPKGGRKGAVPPSPENQTPFARLTDHKESIEATGTLDINELCSGALWSTISGYPLANPVIQKFQPLWNIVVEGFGNHDPGKGRYQGRRPLWDEPSSTDLGNPLQATKLTARRLSRAWRPTWRVSHQQISVVGMPTVPNRLLRNPRTTKIMVFMPCDPSIYFQSPLGDDDLTPHRKYTYHSPFMEQIQNLKTEPNETHLL